ncbi:hypothetical protein [Microcoleus sp. S13_B4]|uniref:hypothetical protein n=1 Tax=Microcoleus sp. S13_B4 TaxID=3055408 RepID=UPI002FD07C48
MSKTGRGAWFPAPDPVSQAVWTNPIAFETGIWRDLVEAERVKKDGSTNASIERL